MSYPFSLGTYEPYNTLIHGGNTDQLLIIYEYTLDEFYNNSWKSELKFYKKQNLSLTRNRQHPFLRNYHKIMKKSSIELVEIIEVDNVMYCVLHTYKINILKRKWRKYKYNQIINDNR
jgi:asparagine synthetase B (glutamine-hydrolysing)